MTKADKLKLCSGCRDNFYNGNNDMGIKECWMLENAEVVKKMFVPVWQRPPYSQNAEETLDCHNRKGYAGLLEAK